MPRIINPRWGEDGVGIVPEVDLDRARLAAALKIAGIEDDQSIDRLKADIEDIARRHLSWIAQDEKGPRRAERNQALRVLIEAGQGFDGLLDRLKSEDLQIVQQAMAHGASSEVGIRPSSRQRRPKGESRLPDPGPDEPGWRTVEDLKYQLAVLSLQLERQIRVRSKMGAVDEHQMLKEALQAVNVLCGVLATLDHAALARLIDELWRRRAEAAITTGQENEGDGQSRAAAEVPGMSTVPGDGDQPDFDTTTLRELRRMLALVLCAGRKALAADEKLKGPEVKKTLPWTIDQLVELYETESGRAFTHNPYRAIEDYSGAPQSAGGCFVVAVMALIDPDIRQTEISSMLAGIVRRRNREDS